MAGLVAFGSFLEEIGLDAHLAAGFERLKPGSGVIYPMHAQMRLLIDLFAVGEERIFAAEALANDSLFVHLADDAIPDVSTLYRDVRRFDDPARAMLEQMVTAQGQEVVRGQAVHTPFSEVHLDLDTSVLPVFGEQDGSGIGHNPRYHRRPSYQVLLARVAEANAYVMAELRSGATSFSGADAVHVKAAIERTREAVGTGCVIYTRIDAAADCGDILAAIEQAGAYALVKLRATPDLKGWVTELRGKRWQTTDWDEKGRPLTQVAETGFWRASWLEAGVRAARVIAVRTREERSGKQLKLWDDEWTVQFFVTNDAHLPAEEVQPRYHGRAGIEPSIAEQKNDMALGKLCTWDQGANEATVLLRVLTFNLLQRWVGAQAPRLRHWRVRWQRRALLTVAGRLCRHAGQLTLRLPPSSELYRLQR